ncbi:MAG: hypothetical protein NVS2B3_03870 [Vulcanimicrobiaceae bacterium]
MKMTVEIDCTPQEARTFVGLPDLEPMQKAVLAQMERRLVEAASGMSAEAVLRTWFSLVPGSENYLKSMTKFLKAPMRSGESRGGTEPN